MSFGQSPKPAADDSHVVLDTMAQELQRNFDALKQNISLLYHRNVTVLDVLLARIVLESAGATGSFIVLSVVLIGTDQGARRRIGAKPAS